VLGFEGVAEVCLAFLPGYREGQAWKEVIDDCYCKIVVLASTYLDALPVGIISASLSLHEFSLANAKSYEVRTLLVRFVHPVSRYFGAAVGRQAEQAQLFGTVGSSHNRSKVVRAWFLAKMYQTGLNRSQLI
jgi:hypothetical protein